MATQNDMEPTLPSVVADLDGVYRGTRLTLTIAFHPDPERIGQAFTRPFGSGKWSLGRNAPTFYSPALDLEEQCGQSLGDQRISRTALQFESRGTSLLVNRPVNACRTQINNAELDEQMALESAQLKRGVVVRLAHSVVLVLRELSDVGEVIHNAALAPALRGGSAYMNRLRGQILAAAASDLDVLVLGETGTGKELVAQAIHANSVRSNCSLVSVNMAAIPAPLAPSALFGNARGAYTGAEVAAKGYFEQSQGGILFMDEVGDAPAEIQAQLLRVLQQREIQVVGGPVRALDFRVIAATDASVEAGSGFKAALRHRLGGCEIVLQPLRDHPEDIGELMWFFLANYFSQSGRANLLPGAHSKPREIAGWADLFQTFILFPWPGNVRQLSNFCHLVVQASLGRLCVPEQLKNYFCEQPEQTSRRDSSVRRNQSVSDNEFMAAMESASYEPKRAARILNISRTSVYRRIERCDQLEIASRVSQQCLQEALSTCGGDLERAAAFLKVSLIGLRARVRASGKTV